VRHKQPAVLLLIENDMADIAAAQFATQRIWHRLDLAAHQPRLTLDGFDGFCEDLRDVEAGLAAGRRACMRERDHGYQGD
jgi:hypothetical protein